MSQTFVCGNRIALKIPRAKLLGERQSTGFRVLVVGGTGQVGSGLVRSLLATSLCTEVVMVNRRTITNAASRSILVSQPKLPARHREPAAFMNAGTGRDAARSQFAMALTTDRTAGRCVMRSR